MHSGRTRRKSILIRSLLVILFIWGLWTIFTPALTTISELAENTVYIAEDNVPSISGLAAITGLASGDEVKTLGFNIGCDNDSTSIINETSFCTYCNATGSSSVTNFSTCKYCNISEGSVINFASCLNSTIASTSTLFKTSVVKFSIINDSGIANSTVKQCNTLTMTIANKSTCLLSNITGPGTMLNSTINFSFFNKSGEIDRCI